MFTTDSQSFANLASIVVARSEADNFAAACALTGAYCSPSATSASATSGATT